MIITIDIETYKKENGKLIPDLDADFTLGVIYFENDKYEIYYNKNEMWERIIELGKKEHKRKKVLNVYAHHHQFDSSKYMDILDPNIVRFCDSPFIYAYKFEGKEIIKFLDTMSLIRGSLKNMGELIGVHKWEMPENEEATLDNIAKYCIQDCRVTMEGIKFIKKTNKELNINVKRLYTINQIAGNNLLKKLKEYEHNHIFDYPQRNIVHQTLRKDEIHEAYRGGRCEAFQLGKFDKVSYLDVNSLYPYASTLIDVPHLKSERLIKNPTKFITKNELFNKIGLSRCVIYNKNNDLGILPIRLPKGNYFPKSNSIIIGTWTHYELKIAIKEGYEILYIDWSIIYTENGFNSFKPIMESMYKQRLKNTCPFKNYYFKMLMNAGIGKLAQHRSNQEIIIDDMELIDKYLKEGYEAIEGVDNELLYKYVKKNIPQTKPYYMPIIPTLINAKARCIMYEHYKKIPKEDLIYTDTDSIIFKGNHKNKFDIKPKKLGAFKLEIENEKAKIVGRKTYAVGDKHIKIAGFKNKKIDFEIFDKGIIESLKMITFNTMDENHKVGTFLKEKRNLNNQLKEQKIIFEKLANEKIFRDDNIKSITKYMPYINIKLKELYNS